MIKDITIGQYFPINSALHRSDPRAKLILTLVFIITVFVSDNFISFALVGASLIAAVIISKVPLKVILKSLKPIVILVLFTSLMNIFFIKEGESLVDWKFIHITVTGVLSATFLAIRIIFLVVSSSLLTYTTSPTMLTDAIEWILTPLKLLKINVHSIAMMMTIALRFIPILIDEIERIMNAQKARGADMENGGILKRIKSLVPIFIPLLVSSLKRAYDLAFAMECRCYRGGEGRTRMKKMQFRPSDFAAMILCTAILAAVIVINFFVPAVI